jgi:hypothetical protein
MTRPITLVLFALLFLAGALSGALNARAKSQDAPPEHYRMAYYVVDEQFRYVYDRGSRRCFAIWGEGEGNNYDKFGGIAFIGVTAEQDCR